MTARAITADVLLGAAVLVVLAASAGLLAMRGVYNKLHFLTPISLVAPFLVAVAIGVQMGLRENTADSWLALAFLVIAGPFLTHATLRTARIRDTGDWRPGGRGGRGRKSTGSKRKGGPAGTDHGGTDDGAPGGTDDGGEEQ